VQVLLCRSILYFNEIKINWISFKILNDKSIDYLIFNIIMRTSRVTKLNVFIIVVYDTCMKAL